MIDTLDSVFQDLDPDENFFNEMYCGGSKNSLCYFIETYNQIFRSKNNLKIFHSNIRSYNANCDHFHSILNSLSSIPDVVCLTETWFNSDSIDMHGFTGFNSYHTIRPNLERGGGVSVFVRNQVKSSKLCEFLICNNTIETCAVKVSLQFFDLIIFSIYKTHSDNTENFTNLLKFIVP